MEFINFDPEELYAEIKERARSEGAFTEEEWVDIVDDAIASKEEFGEVHDDEEISAVREVLKKRFKEFEQEIPKA